MLRFSLLLLLATSTVAVADTTLHFTNHRGENSLVQTHKQLVRVEQAQAGSLYMLFNNRNQTLTVVNAQDKNYHVITPARIEQASKKIANAKAQLMASFPKLPKDQQERLRPIMEKMQAAEKRSLSTQKLKDSKVGAYSCTEYQVLDNGQATQKLCSATASNLNISADDHQSISAMLDMLAELSNKMGGGMMQGAVSPVDIGGIPILTSERDNKKHTTLTKIDHRKIAADRFEVPPDYSQTELPQ